MRQKYIKFSTNGITFMMFIVYPASKSSYCLRL